MKVETELIFRFIIEMPEAEARDFASVVTRAGVRANGAGLDTDGSMLLKFGDTLTQEIVDH